MITRQRLMDAMRSENIADSLYRLIPKDRRKDFINFAKAFGMTEKEVKSRIRVLNCNI